MTITLALNETTELHILVNETDWTWQVFEDEQLTYWSLYTFTTDAQAFDDAMYRIGGWY